MAGQDWSIRIEPDGDTFVFNPSQQNAENSDMISWNNRSDETHQPWPANEDWEPLPDDQVTKAKAGCTYLSDPIEAWESWSPAYVCAAPLTGSTTLYYVCRFHPDEHGTIVVSA